MFANAKDLVIICSAPFYIQHTLTVYQQALKLNKRVRIVVTDTVGVYDFLKSLHLDLDLLHFEPTPPAFHFGHPFVAFEIRKQIHHISELLFSHQNPGEMVYFGMINQLIVASLVSRASKSGWAVTDGSWPPTELHYLSACSLRLAVRKMAISFIADCPLVYGSLGKSFTHKDLLFINRRKLGINAEQINPAPNVLTEFEYRPAHKLDPSKTILFIESCDGKYYQNYEIRTQDILFRIRQAGFHILLKPHPRLGCSNFLRELVDDILPSKVPAQFIDKDCFRFVMTNMSTAIMDFSKLGIPSFCLEKLHCRINPSDGVYILQVLTQPSLQSSGIFPILYPETLDIFITNLIKSSNGEVSQLG